ncbi:hypothetical protein [Sphingobacterium sp. LRF_L2]|uniref:hypothetical protein n=1 Tax=Sphingobacterium sp. LRF_L2 TaxID=3369421 RepID=UPI003F5F3D28
MKKAIVFYTALCFVAPIACSKKVPEQAIEQEVVFGEEFLEGNDGDPDIGDLTATGIFYDKFEGAALDETKWTKEHRVWGQPADVNHQHGGVIRENVYLKEGNLVLRALGDQYTGTLRGVNGFAKRLGGVVSTKERFGAGRYEVKMRILQKPDVGVLSSAWTFYYKELKDIQAAAYQKALGKGNIAAADGTLVLNHEIDIEVLGANLKTSMFTTWIGERDQEHYNDRKTVEGGLSDGKYHVYRWDWYTGNDVVDPHVDFYIDGVLLHTSTAYVPYLSSYFYVGNWFAWWAGADSGNYKAPDFDTAEMYVDWFKFTPFLDNEIDETE